MAGRPTKLTELVFNAIVTSVSNGNQFSTACEAAGVAEDTGLEWLRRGEGRHHKRETNELFAEFARQIRRAQAQIEQEMVSVIKRAATGYEETTTTRELDPKKKDKEGKPKIRSIIVKQVRKIDWRAALAYLTWVKKPKRGDTPDED